MDYYFSGIGAAQPNFIRYSTRLIPYRLLSCHGSYKAYAHKWITETIECGHGQNQTIMLDSGAFTAWNKGTPIDLKHLLPVYREFVGSYLHKVKEIWLINLDKIPGSPGVDPSIEQIDEAMWVSDQNYETLVREFGPRILPVFHQGESSQRLNAIEAMGEYICVSPRNDVGEIHRVRWARDVHSRLPQGKMTHGLAATGFAMMTTVPWQSVDSATWVAHSSYGMVLTSLNGMLHVIGVSSDTPARHNEEQHVETLNSLARRDFMARVEEAGMTLENLRHDYKARLAFSMREVQHWVDHHYRCTFVPNRTLWDL